MRNKTRGSRCEPIEESQLASVSRMMGECTIYFSSNTMSLLSRYASESPNRSLKVA